MVEETGTVAYISKFGGLKFTGDERWFNPTTPLTKEDITIEKYKDKVVTINVVNDKNKFNKIEFDEPKAVGEEESMVPKAPTPDVGPQRLADFKEREANKYLFGMCFNKAMDHASRSACKDNRSIENPTSIAVLNTTFNIYWEFGLEKRKTLLGN